MLWTHTHTHTQTCTRPFPLSPAPWKETVDDSKSPFS